jgi:hypothetical protein
MYEGDFFICEERTPTAAVALHSSNKAGQENHHIDYTPINPHTV